MVPLPLMAWFSKPLVKIISILSLAAALFLSGLYVGYKMGLKSHHEAVIESQRHSLKLQAKRQDVTVQTIVKYVDRVVKVREEAQTIIKEVPVYVQDTCTLSPGVRLLHDAAAQGQLPAPG